MRALRDELDCLRDRAGRAEQLQTELQSCTHRLRSLEVTRTQLKVSPKYTAHCFVHRDTIEGFYTYTPHTV